MLHPKVYFFKMKTPFLFRQKLLVSQQIATLPEKLVNISYIRDLSEIWQRIKFL
jgi:hypothetical protein